MINRLVTLIVVMVSPMYTYSKFIQLHVNYVHLFICQKKFLSKKAPQQQTQ